MPPLWFVLRLTWSFEGEAVLNDTRNDLLQINQAQCLRTFAGTI